MMMMMANIHMPNPNITLIMDVKFKDKENFHVKTYYEYITSTKIIIYLKKRCLIFEDVTIHNFRPLH
jgi:hypothetical protein